MSTQRELLVEQDRLQREAAEVRADLALDERFAGLGSVVLVGSAALGLMVWRDLDLTVVCPRLDIARVASVATPLVEHARVRQVLLRDDTGDWNNEPSYPDGVYLGLRYRTPAGDDWKVDIWFVDEPDRQPDLTHLRTLPERITDERRSSILRIKHAWADHPDYGRTFTSHDIYTAVLDEHVQNTADFDGWLARRSEPRVG
jgi:hypothetical protein